LDLAFGAVHGRWLASFDGRSSDRDSAEMGDEAAVPEEVDPNLDPSDPDTIAQRPPPKAIDAKTYFQVNHHEGKWSEYDERGVPQKNIKKKKPTKKEKDALETEYLDASKAYQKYLKDVENWEQAKLDAEKGLKKSDRLRWSFRQVGEKMLPIDPDDMETIVKLMGWFPLTAREFKVVKKGLNEIVNPDSQIELDALRGYVRDVMPILLMEDRLLCEQLDAIELEELYSPRTWRGKIQEAPPPSKKKSPRSARGGQDSSRSPRSSVKKPTGGGSSARGGGSSARGRKSVKSTGEAPAATAPSPRGKGKKSDKK